MIYHIDSIRLAVHGEPTMNTKSCYVFVTAVPIAYLLS